MYWDDFKVITYAHHVNYACLTDLQTINHSYLQYLTRFFKILFTRLTAQTEDHEECSPIEITLSRKVYITL